MTLFSSAGDVDQFKLDASIKSVTNAILVYCNEYGGGDDNGDGDEDGVDVANGRKHQPGYSHSGHKDVLRRGNRGVWIESCFD